MKYEQSCSIREIERYKNISSVLVSGITIILFLLLSTYRTEAAVISEADRNLVQNVAQKIYASYRFTFTPPAVKVCAIEKFPKSPRSKVALFYPHSFYSTADTIYLQDSAFWICRGFGADSLNAIAFILGHELGHYFQGHAETSDFEHNSFIKTGLSYTDNLRKEAEADLFAGFFGYLAGYNTIGISGKVISRLYEVFSIQPRQDYPTLEQRVATSDSVNEYLSKYLPIFEAGLFYFAGGEYDNAIECFHFLGSDAIFPSREMYNNEAVSYLHKAMYDAGVDFRFRYPVIMDNQSKLAVEDFLTSARGTDPSLKSYIRKAIMNLQKAIKIDKEYPLSYINLACAYDLLEEQDSALAILQQLDTTVLNMNIKRMVYSAYGIIYSNQEEKMKLSSAKTLENKADKYLKLAKKENAPNSLFNLLVSRKEKPEKKAHSQPFEKQLYLYRDEDEKYALSDLLYSVNAVGDDTRILSNSRQDCSIIKIETDEFASGIAISKKHSNLKSENNLEVGTGKQEMVEAMGGQPSVITYMKSAEYCFYKFKGGGGIVYEIVDDKVSHWSLLSGNRRKY